MSEIQMTLFEEGKLEKPSKSDKPAFFKVVLLPPRYVRTMSPKILLSVLWIKLEYS